MKYVLRVKDIKTKNFFNITTGNSDVARRHDEFFVCFVKDNRIFVQKLCLPNIRVIIFAVQNKVVFSSLEKTFHCTAKQKSLTMLRLDIHINIQSLVRM